MTRRLVPMALLVLASCGEAGTYELRWRIGAEVSSARDCSAAGIDAVEVLARRGSDEQRSVFACFTDEGPVGRGPDLDEGEHQLAVYALTAAGQRLSGPTMVGALVPAKGIIAVSVDLPAPPACGDGIDNDQDGRVDLFDTGCSALDDPSEAE